jgi:hypothetical protein
MCEKNPRTDTTQEQQQAVQHAPQRERSSDLALTGSRRRRIWELPYHALCPVIGVCMPIAVLRRLIGKALGGTAIADDYEIHCGAIAECKQRSAITECLQQELDRRYAIALRRVAKIKNSVDLQQCWTLAQHGNDVAGALWACLTHARCDPDLEERILSEIHMLQHQIGSAERISAQRFLQMQAELEALGKSLLSQQERSSKIIAAKSASIELLQTDQWQMRATLIGKNTLIASLQDQYKELQQGMPDLRARQEQAHYIELQMARNHELERHIVSLQEQLRQQARLPASNDRPEKSATLEIDEPVKLQHQSILCVGGRPNIVPMYRQLIEGSGANFMHHDGGDEDNAALLSTSLVAADLVICQTGCVSHAAYWRVKDHCKRTGKLCVFVDKPSVSSMARCLKQLQIDSQAEMAATLASKER